MGFTPVTIGVSRPVSRYLENCVKVLMCVINSKIHRNDKHNNSEVACFYFIRKLLNNKAHVRKLELRARIVVCEPNNQSLFNLDKVSYIIYFYVLWLYFY